MSEEQSKGLGDTVEKIITKIGDVTELKFIKNKKGCSGCRQRKEWLNKNFPYRMGDGSDSSSSSTDPQVKKEEAPCSDCEKKKKKKGGCKGCGKNK